MKVSTGELSNFQFVGRTSVQRENYPDEDKGMLLNHLIKFERLQKTQQ